MAIREEIAAIREDGDGDKARRIRRLKADRFIEALSARLPLSWTRGANALTLTRARLGGKGGNDLELVLRLERDGKNVSLNNPFVFVNPPILVPDAEGDIIQEERNVSGEVVGERRFAESPLRAARQIIEDVVGVTVRGG